MYYVFAALLLFARMVICFSLETLFYENGVDVIIQGHEHSYERLWPVYNETVTGKNYINPRAPVHIISGAAGCNEILGICLDPILGPKGEIHNIVQCCLCGKIFHTVFACLSSPTYIHPL